MEVAPAPSEQRAEPPTEPAGYSALRAEASSAGPTHGGRPLNDPRLRTQAQPSTGARTVLDRARSKIDGLATTHEQVEATTSIFGRVMAHLGAPLGEKSSVALTGPELMALMGSAKDLARIDGIRVTYDDNVFGLKTPNTESHTVLVSARVLMGERYPNFLDDEGASNRMNPEASNAAAFIAQRFVGKDKINVLQIEAVRNLHADRAEFETFSKIPDPRALPDGAPIAAHFVDMFSHYHQGGFGGAKDGFSEYAKGEILRMAGEPYLALEDGRVLRMNRQVFEVRTRVESETTDREKTMDRAFDAYGVTWGHNDNGGHGGATHTFERGKGASAEVLNELRSLVQEDNPYLLSGILLRYHDEATQTSKLATFSIRELKPSAFTTEGLELPGLPLIKYTNVLGLKGRAGDGYGHLMPTMEA